MVKEGDKNGESAIEAFDNIWFRTDIFTDFVSERVKLFVETYESKIWWSEVERLCYENNGLRQLMATFKEKLNESRYQGF